MENQTNVYNGRTRISMTVAHAAFIQYLWWYRDDLDNITIAEIRLVTSLDHLNEETLEEDMRRFNPSLADLALDDAPWLLTPRTPLQHPPQHWTYSDYMIHVFRFLEWIDFDQGSQHPSRVPVVTLTEPGENSSNNPATYRAIRALFRMQDFTRAEQFRDHHFATINFNVSQIIPNEYRTTFSGYTLEWNASATIPLPHWAGMTHRQVYMDYEWDGYMIEEIRRRTNREELIVSPNEWVNYPDPRVFIPPYMYDNDEEDLADEPVVIPEEPAQGDTEPNQPEEVPAEAPTQSAEEVWGVHHDAGTENGWTVPNDNAWADENWGEVAARWGRETYDGWGVQVTQRAEQGVQTDILIEVTQTTQVVVETNNEPELTEDDVASEAEDVIPPEHGPFESSSPRPMIGIQLALQSIEIDEEQLGTRVLDFDEDHYPFLPDFGEDGYSEYLRDPSSEDELVTTDSSTDVNSQASSWSPIPNGETMEEEENVTRRALMLMSWDPVRRITRRRTL